MHTVWSRTKSAIFELNACREDDSKLILSPKQRILRDKHWEQQLSRTTLGSEIMQLWGEDIGSQGNIIKVRQEKRNVKSTLHYLTLYITSSNFPLAFQVSFSNQ